MKRRPIRPETISILGVSYLPTPAYVVAEHFPDRRHQIGFRSKTKRVPLAAIVWC